MITYIQTKNRNLKSVLNKLDGHVQKLRHVYLKRSVERQRMSDEGFPGSQEPFNAPLFDLEYTADELIDLVNEIKDLSKSLRNTDVEDWK